MFYITITYTHFSVVPNYIYFSNTSIALVDDDSDRRYRFNLLILTQSPYHCKYKCFLSVNLRNNQFSDLSMNCKFHWLLFHSQKRFNLSIQIV